MSTPVSFYGLHTTDEGIIYLHQGRNAVNFINLKQMSPFQVSLRKNRPCPHLINATTPVPDPVQWNQFVRLLGDPLVENLLPIPKGRMDLIPYINDPQNELVMDLVILSRLSSPIYPVVMPFRKLTRAALLDELQSTNVCPLILTNVLTEDNDYLNEIAREARTAPRRVLFSGDPAVVIRAPLQRITSAIWDVNDLELAAMPMESFGAVLVRRYARGEKLDAELRRGNDHE